MSICRSYFVAAALAATAASAEIVLYDGALGTLPGSQGWLYITDPFPFASATQSAIGGATRLDSTPVMSDKAGYFNIIHPQLQNLDRSAGFKVRFDARINAEAHVSADRAGFSVIVLANDLGGIEIGFWTNEIWAQSDAPLFTHAESVSCDTTSGTNRFEVAVVGQQYELLANGISILTGPVRNYSSFGSPYTTPNFIFLGDDTSSAAAQIDLSRVSVSLFPHIHSMALASGTVFMSLSNLESALTFEIQRINDLSSTNWITIDSLSRTGAITEWSGAIDANATGSFFRVRVP